jgi:iron(III) transport system substrate-binding protein
VRIAGVPAEHLDPGRAYFGTKLITTGIMHHVRAPFVPRRWAELAEPRARGQLAMPSPAVSGAAAIHVETLVQNPALGWPYVEKLVANGVQARGGNGPVMQAVAGAERAFGIVIDYLPIREAAKGAPVRFVFPEDGVSAITEPAGILSTARNVPAAVALLDFLLSREGQQLASSQGFLPADPAVAPPAGFPDPKTIKVMPLDNARAAREQQATLRRFAQLVGG